MWCHMWYHIWYDVMLKYQVLMRCLLWYHMWHIEFLFLTFPPYVFKQSFRSKPCNPGSNLKIYPRMFQGRRFQAFILPSPSSEKSWSCHHDCARSYSDPFYDILHYDIILQYMISYYHIICCSVISYYDIIEYETIKPYLWHHTITSCMISLWYHTIFMISYYDITSMTTSAIPLAMPRAIPRAMPRAHLWHHLLQ